MSKTMRVPHLLQSVTHLSQEIAYTQKRLCVRVGPKEVQQHLKEAADAVEKAIKVAQTVPVE